MLGAPRTWLVTMAQWIQWHSAQSCCSCCPAKFRTWTMVACRYSVPRRVVTPCGKDWQRCGQFDNSTRTTRTTRTTRGPMVTADLIKRSNCGPHANASQECERLWSDQDNLEKDIGTLSGEPLEYDWWFCSIETSIWCWFPTSTTPWIFFIREVVRFVSRNPGIPCSKPENLTRTPQTYARATKSSSLLGVINPTFQNNAVVEQQLFWHHFFIVLYCYIMLYIYIWLSLGIYIHDIWYIIILYI